MRNAIRILLLLICAVSLMGASAAPIPNGTGFATLAGINARFLGSVPISPSLSMTTVTANQSIDPTSAVSTFNVDATSNNITLTFNNATGTGKILIFNRVDSGSNTVTLRGAPSGGGRPTQNIFGLPAGPLSAQYDSVEIQDVGLGFWQTVGAGSGGGGGGGTLAGDANGAAGSNTVNTVLSGQTPISASTSMTGDLAGNLPSPTVARMHLGITNVTHGSSPYSASSTDSALECDASGGAVSISLPGTTTGKMILVKKIDSTTNACTISTALDGTTNYKLSAQNQSITAYYNASTTHWNVLSGNASTPMDSIAGIAGGVSDSISNMSVNGTFNVKSPLFGATGSGIFGTDDAGAIQAAINAACLSNNVSDAHVSATTVSLPAGSYRMTYPAWVNCAGLTLAGSGMYSSVLSPTYDFGPTVVYVAGAYPGVPLASPLIGSTGNSFDFTQDRSHHPWINLREWDGTAGPLAGIASCTGVNAPSRGCVGTGTGNFGLNLNGQPAFTVEAYVNDVTAGDGTIVGSGSEPSISAGQKSAFEMHINSSAWAASITTSGSGQVSATNFGAVTTGTTYYVAETYDGANLRIYHCVPGSTSCAPDATTAATGTIVQDPTEDVDIGGLQQFWPNGSFFRGSINGKVYSVRVSNIARWTGTIATVPNAAFTQDANTLIVTNGEQAPGGAPFYKGYNVAPSGGYGFGWLFGYNTDRVQSGNYYIAENAMRDLGIRGVTDTSGIIYVAGKDSSFDNLYLQTMEVGIENFNLAYEARNFSNIAILGAPGRYGINDQGGGLNTFKGIKINSFWACEVANSGTWINPVCIQGNNGTSRYGFVLDNLGGNNGAEVALIDMADDSENSGNLQTPLYVLGTPGANTTLNVVGGGPVAEDGSPIAVIDSGGTINFEGTEITSDGGSPTQIVQSTGSTTGAARMVNPTFIGWGSAPLSSTAGAARVTPCRGLVTLSSGAGTFSDVCVTTRSVCSALDTTTFANAVTLAAPAAGSVAMTGTGTDAIQLSCN